MNNHNTMTMKDIARELGISVSTVSRALDNSPSISAAKRQMIQDYAREHNFTPNSVAKNLRHTKSKPTKIIGVILPEIVHYYFASVLDGIEEEARRRGYRILVAQSHESYEQEMEICQAFFESRVCGVIVSLAKETKQYDHFRALQDHGMPVVFYDRICHGIDASRVVNDDYQSVFNATKYLIDTGCRNIAFFGSPMHLEISKNRFNGYKDALQQHGIAFAEDMVRIICDDCQEAELVAPEFLDKENHPDAFVAVNDDTAIGVLRAVKRAGYKVPDEISIIGYSDGVSATSSDPQLTTINQRGKKVGKEAVDILISKVENVNDRNKVTKRVVKTELVIRGTTKQLK